MLTSGGGSRLTEGRKARFSVILNLFQDLVNGRFEGKRVGRYAVIKRYDNRKLRGQGDLKIVIAQVLRDLVSIPLSFLERAKILDKRSEFSILGEGVNRGLNVRRLRSWTDSTVIPNLFQNPILGRLENKPSSKHYFMGEGVSMQTQLEVLQVNVTNHPHLQSLSYSLALPQGSEKRSSHFTLHHSLKRKAAFTLAEGATHVALWNKQRKIAFTLAEVLITLGIIGVVAAMTMPSLIQEHREKATVAKLKKVYSTLNNAILLSVNEYGPLSDWNLSSGDVDSTGSSLIAERLKENIILIKDCKSDGGCFGDAYKTLGTVNERFSGGANNFSTFVLSDGVSVATWAWAGSLYYNGAIMVDVNGKKGPNTTGKDAFWFGIKESSIVPFGTKDEPSSDFTFENCINPVGAYYTSRGCTAWVIFNENMDYLHCNDLSWDGKTKCK